MTSPKTFAVILLLLGPLLPAARAADAAKPVSPTFAEILTRVAERDKDTGAILTVKPRVDAPPRNFGLDFSMTEVPFAGEVVIIVEERLKSGDGVFEKYRLTIDDAITKELANRKRYAARAPK